MRIFNKNDEKNICKMYSEEGKTLEFIRCFYHCRNEAIKTVLTKYNIPIKKRGLSKNRQIKENFFENIDTEEKAYILGLFFTDGYVVLGKNGRSPNIGISLKITDIEILNQIRNILNITSAISYDKRKNKECVSLNFRNQKISEDLAKYGIVPNKTYKTKHLPEIPSTFLKHFLRGLLDGDGSIYQETASKKYRIDFCSYHQSICEEFRQKCNSLLDKKNTNIIANYGTAYHIKFNDQKTVKQLATILYKDSKISLARKQKLAENLFEDNSEEDIVYSDH